MLVLANSGEKWGNQLKSSKLLVWNELGTVGKHEISLFHVP